MSVVAVIDFETTGLSSNQGDSATEIAAVLVGDGKIVDRYQSLMNAGIRVPPFIEQYTGITNAMMHAAPSATKVMQEVAEFVGNYPLVAHNASFDCKFWDAELGRIRHSRRQESAYSMLVARRIYPQAPSHKLGILVDYAKLPIIGKYHRALADAEMTAHLLIHMVNELQRRYKLDAVPHELLRTIQSTPRHQIDQCVKRYLGAQIGLT